MISRLIWPPATSVADHVHDTVLASPKCRRLSADGMISMSQHSDPGDDPRPAGHSSSQPDSTDRSQPPARIRTRLTRSVAIDGLVVFRVALGASVAWFAVKFLGSTALAHDYIDPPFHLTYYGLGWVRPWPGNGMYFHFLALAASGLGVAVGMFYRFSAVVMFLAFTHVFLAERALYNNHYYLISLLSLLICFMPLHGRFSVDALRSDSVKRATVPVWMPWLLRFQLGIVYFYGGIAKLNADWLQGQPMRMWLAAETEFPLIGHLFTEDWMVQFFVWGGILLDLLAVPLLLYRHTRLWMFSALLLFHLMNSQLFHIGVFPWLMMAATTIFFPSDWPGRLVKLPGTTGSRQQEQPQSSALSGPAFCVLALYCLLQIVVPLRHFFMPGDASWTEDGHQFAWRMMLREKQVGIRFHGRDKETGRTGVIDIRQFLTGRQAISIARNPDLMVQYARWLAQELKQTGAGDAEIRATCLVSLNGRKPQLLFDPEIDLAAEPRRLGVYPWVLPLTEPLRHNAWDVPMSQWESHPELAEARRPDNREQRHE